MCRQTRRSRSWICSNRTSRDAGRRARMEIDPDAPGLIKERLTPAGSCSRPGRTHAIPARTGHFPHEAQRITRSSRARRQVHPSVVRLRVLVRTACSPRMHHQPGLSVKNRIVIWLATGLLRVLAFLPYTAVARFGEGLGALLYRIPSARRRVVHTNLELCFPDMGEAERERLARAHFRHVIRSYVERGPQWFGNARSLARLVEVESAIDLAGMHEKPTIFVGFHFVGIEAGCMMYSTLHSVASLYTPMSDVLIDALSLRQRARLGTE